MLEWRPFSRAWGGTSNKWGQKHPKSRSREPDLFDPIFLFLEALGQACAQTDGQAHAYGLMPTHFHLVIIPQNRL
jgi:hypothetical protein